MTRIPRRAILLLAVLALAALAAAVGAVAPGAGAPPAAPTARPHAPAERLVLALLEPERIVSISLGTGEVTTLQLQSGTLGRSPLLLLDGRRIVYLAPGPHGGSRVMSVDPALRERPRWLANADVVVPAPVPTEMWIASHGPHGHWLVQRLTLGGRVIESPRRHAAALPILGAVWEGLVLQGRHGHLFTWEPTTGRRRRTVPGSWALAADGGLLASCGGRCGTLLLTDGWRGRVVHAPRGQRFLPVTAATQPGGALLALPLTPATGPHVALVDIRTGAVRRLGGPPGMLGARPALSFSPDGKRLYAVDWLERVRVFGSDGRAGGIVADRVGAPVVQLLAAPEPPVQPAVPRFAWLPPGWRQLTDAPVSPGAPAGRSVTATSWPYRPSPHGPAGALPPRGVLVSVLLLPDRRHLPRDRAGGPLTPRLALPARPSGTLEGRPDVPEYRLGAVCGTRRVDVRVDAAAGRLTTRRRAQVQRMLDALVLPAAPGGCRAAP